VALDPKNGRELWRFPWETGYDTNNADPLVNGDRIFITSYTRGCALLTVRHGKPELIYDKKTLFNNLCTGVLLNSYLFAFNGEAKTDTDFRCLFLPSGESRWSRKDPAFGTVIAAGGKLVVLSEKGELIVGDASASEFKPLARAQILGGRCWTPPALANGLLYARNASGEIVCVDLRH
jgi:outer membrane protein assembly factor BamB